ncbi:polysaccharide biosynthesis/export family protein [Hansschlegelia beijingensis]
MRSDAKLLGRSSGRGRVVAFACVLGLLLASPGHAQEPPGAYRVGPGDVLQITVLGKPELSGKFRVGPEGAVSYPLLGDLRIADLTTGQVVATLNEELSRRLPLRSAPAVEIAEFAGVFVTGDVEKPGQYVYRPGMIALELIALSGGLRRSAAALNARALQLISAEQEVAERRLTLFAGGMQRARLEAEIAGADFAPAAEDDSRQRSVPADDVRTILANEKALFAVRRKVLEDGIAALHQQRLSYDQEIAALRESKKLHDEEIGLLEQEVANSQKMVDKGLGLLPSLLALKRQLSATRRDSLDIESYLARAQQRQLEVDQKIQDLGDQRIKESAADLRELDVRLAQERQKLRSSISALAEVQDQLGQDAPSPARPIFKVARVVGGAYQEKAVDQFARLSPRDILLVSRDERDDASLSQTSSALPAPTGDPVQTPASSAR